MIRKIVTKFGQVKWEVYLRTTGRGSKQIRRRFDRRVDAETFLHEQKSKLRLMKRSPLEAQNFEDTTFKTEAEHWLNTRKDLLSPGYLYRVEGILKELLPTYGHFEPNKFHPGFLSGLRSQMLSRDLTPATVNRKLNVITAILNFSAEEQRIPFNPTAKFKQLKEVRDHIQHWGKRRGQTLSLLRE